MDWLANQIGSDWARAVGQLVGINVGFVAVLDLHGTPEPTTGRLRAAVVDDHLHLSCPAGAVDDRDAAAMIATGEVDMLIFFIDPLSALPHDVDVKALTRLAAVYDIPMALNRATAEKFIDFQ